MKYINRDDDVLTAFVLDELWILFLMVPVVVGLQGFSILVSFVAAFEDADRLCLPWFVSVNMTLEIGAVGEFHWTIFTLVRFVSSVSSVVSLHVAVLTKCFVAPYERALEWLGFVMGTLMDLQVAFRSKILSAYFAIWKRRHEAISYKGYLPIKLSNTVIAMLSDMLLKQELAGEDLLAVIHFTLVEHTGYRCN